MASPMARLQQEKQAAVTTGSAGSARHSLRDGFNGFLRTLPGDRAFLPPSPARRGTRLCGLSASVGAPGPHDFAVRVKHRSSAQIDLRPALSRPPHSTPNVRDDRDTPLDGQEQNKNIIPSPGTVKNFRCRVRICPRASPCASLSCALNTSTSRRANARWSTIAYLFKENPTNRTDFGTARGVGARVQANLSKARRDANGAIRG
jgi:hypothetical protein